MEEVKSESGYSCVDDEDDLLWQNTCLHNRRMVWVYGDGDDDDDDFDVHVSQSSCDNKTEQELTDTDIEM